MKREEKRNLIMEKILSTSAELMFTQGYKKTTTRQIIEKAGIRYGTLYHFFRDKEDIFLHNAIKIYRDIIQLAGELTVKQKDPISKYALTRGLELKAIETYEKLAELYLEAYSSWRITQAMLPMNIKMYKDYFHKYCSDFTDQDYHDRVLAMRGMRLNFISEFVHTGHRIYESKFNLIMGTTLSLFNIPESKIKNAINFAGTTLREKSITMYGFKL